MKKTNYPKKILFKTLALPINLTAIVLGLVGIILIRALKVANKLHVKLEASEKARYTPKRK
jgi:hypothetical protein